MRAPGRNDPCWCGGPNKYKRCHAAIDGSLRPGTISPTRAVPEALDRPPYAADPDGEPGGPPAPLVKSSDVLERMARTGAAAAEVLALAGAAVRPGITTDELDQLVHEAALARDAYPSPLGYRGFPKSVCASVNEVICHGIPDDRALRDGDIVNLDVTLYREGVHGDTNATFFVGEVDAVSRRLVLTTRQAMLDGIAAVAPGQPVSAIGRAIEARASSHGFGVVREFVGHAVGEQFHGPLQIPHYYDERATTVLEVGMTFTIEPMITLGTPRPELWDDGWTAVTADGLRTAQFEHTIVVTDEGADILTAADAPDGTLLPEPAAIAGSRSG